MAALAKELGMKAGVEKDQNAEVKSSSSITIRSIGDNGDDGDIEDDKQAAVATSRRVSSSLSREGEDERDERDGDGDGDGDGDEPKNDADHHVLTLSRARCIALVATVTGAAFLNVSAMDETCIDDTNSYSVNSIISTAQLTVSTHHRLTDSS